MWDRTMFCLLVLAAGPGMARGQGPRPAASLGSASAAPAPDSLSCPQCVPQRRFWLAAGDLMVAQLVPFAINNLHRKESWARVSPTTWRNNLSYPWQWDDNMFQNNQFAHPFQGSLYYNAARTNGYGFWESAPWPFAGSLMWELFFEAWAPAPNDFVNTSLGGVILGETLFRLSRLPLDNTARGGGRVWREVVSGLLNPISGLNRLVRGETGAVSANPSWWRPAMMFGVLDLGYRQTTELTGDGQLSGETSQWDATFALSYGDPVRDLGRAPFSHFAIRAEVAGPSETGFLSELTARGSLGAWRLGESGRHQAAVSLEYDYFNNPAFVYGGQSIQLGLVSAIGAPGAEWWGQASFLFNGVILGATQSDYYSALEGRDYDYGPGLGTVLDARVLYRNRIQASAHYLGLWLYAIDGAESSHYQAALQLELRYWMSRKLGVGVSYTGYTRRSDYRAHPDGSESAEFIRAFVSSAIPRLPLP